MSTLAYGSCNRQKLPQTFWELISVHKPSHFFWTGDAVYSKGNDLQSMANALQNLTSNEYYTAFTKNVEIDGVWDDHDFGVNDGGNEVDNIPSRQLEYLRFIARSNNDPKPSHMNRKGLFHSVDITLVEDLKVKFIFLDTRSFRDQHWIPSLGVYKYPFTALAAASIRALYSTLGYGRAYDGNILGNDQWLWLEETLATADADVNVVVSSIQVLTSNPVFESWGHFPTEKQRLLSLFQRTDPKGLVLVSGDVHMGEISRASYRRADGSAGQWAEVTSSGLTHSCADGLINMVLCPLMTAVWSSHRRKATVEDGPSLYLGKNFGLLNATKDSDSSGYNVEFLINSLVNHKDQLSSEVVLKYSMHVDPSRRSSNRASIVEVDAKDFFIFSTPIQIILAVIFLVVGIMFNKKNKNKVLTNSTVKSKSK